ncbi:MAG: hypothetical protein Q8L60_12035 [Gammaproteobacteria bacterium]|nr:hypothetical protein [Gammaproteobacteria bacterium]MDP2141648.1 hypothetical protein [Gammaproteobacteria bacterium]MDP2346369.1 hypothetical protein [Gammaproteobacteria bacterium]
MKLYQSVLAGVLLVPAGAMAQEGLSYTWLELDYVNLDIDRVGDGGNIADDFDNGGGFGVQGSLAISDNFFLFANYSDTKADVNFINDAGLFVPAKTDIKKIDLGLGFHTPIATNTDLVFTGAYTDSDRDRFRFGATGDKSLDDLNDDGSDGFFVDAALRSQLTPWLEGSLGARYTDIESVDGVSVIGNLLFELTPALSLNLGVDAGDELSTWVAGVRFSF